MTDLDLQLNQLVASVAAGEVYLTADAANRCSVACTSYIDGLDQMMARVQNLQRTGGFGTLQSGQALDRKFAALAAGTATSLDAIVKQHIEVAQRLRDVFEKAGAGYAQTEDDTTQMITQVGPR